MLLQMKHVAVNVLCPLCNTDRESICHVLVSCSFAQACWHRLGIGCIPTPQGIFSSWLSSILSLYSREKRQWAVMLLWALWKSRNDLVWQQRGSEVDEVIVLAKTVLNQWISAQDRSFDLSMGLVTQTDGSEH
ncbi:uncharacterized protein LOC133824099 [Humulus lupulus]|uniref:uncharacterized protein LOC133824099 n=1 Tax=Humulus lupulus TaxID=3486 RepID=UPI002B416AE7|nr:uncharacterized protein LOC133824099 [Humulus lupulus]